MRFEALDATGNTLLSRIVYSIGGGALLDEDGKSGDGEDIYPYASMQELIKKAEENGLLIWEFAEQHEGPEFRKYLEEVWETMQAAIHRGLDAEGKLPGTLNVPRKASPYHARAYNMSGEFKQTALLFAYALAVSEENASGGKIVTAPTCGSCGVLPAVLFSLSHRAGLSNDKILQALATAGIIGNFVKSNASISGAEVGCQGEVGAACAAVQLLGGAIRQVEYAAEMGLEHHLGLTCDPIGGYVQIPCIERNAIAAVRALDCATYALLSDGRHIVTFDEVVQTLLETGRDIKTGYRETAQGGLAKIHSLHKKIGKAFPGIES
jgi:L-serine dehydratase